MKLKISQIITTAGTQTRAASDEPTIAEYAELMKSGTAMPPIDVYHDGLGYYLADGFHRVMAVSRIKLNDIEATIHKGTLKDAIWHAVGANKDHGLKRNAGDKRIAVVLALKEFPERTQVEIAMHVGCSQGFIAQIKSQLISTNKLTEPETRKGKDGKTRPTTYAKRQEPTAPASQSEPEDAPETTEEPETSHISSNRDSAQQEQEKPSHISSKPVSAQQEEPKEEIKLDTAKAINDSLLHDAKSIWARLPIGYRTELLEEILFDKPNRELAKKIIKNLEAK